MPPHWPQHHENYTRCCTLNKHGFTAVQKTAIHTKMDTHLFSAHQNKQKDM